MRPKKNRKDGNSRNLCTCTTEDSEKMQEQEKHDFCMQIYWIFTMNLQINAEWQNMYMEPQTKCKVYIKCLTYMPDVFEFYKRLKNSNACGGTMQDD